MRKLIAWVPSTVIMLYGAYAIGGVFATVALVLVSLVIAWQHNWDMELLAEKFSGIFRARRG